MTGIVLVKGENTPEETLTCITVTTGAKCLPASQITHCNGLVLHDSHAEILAMRAFNFWLLSECHSYLSREQESPDSSSASARDTDQSVSQYIRRRKRLQISGKEGPEPPFELRPDIAIYMYCTCAPCGDASMELVMAAQEDPTPWEMPMPDPIPTTPSDTSPQPQSQNKSQNKNQNEKPILLSGRAHFQNLGSVRRKPARADAAATKSKSCSDKMALRQVSSLLNYETSLLVAVTWNAYIRGVVLPEEEISRTGVERCFGGGSSGRMRGLVGRHWGTSYDEAGDNDDDDDDETASARKEDGGGEHAFAFHPFTILSIPTAQLKSLWAFRKPRVTDPVPDGETMKKAKPGNISAVWVRAPTSTPTTEHQQAKSEPSVLSPSDNGSKNLPILRGSKTGLFESLINGVRQGHKISSPGIRGASALSRAKMWRGYREVALSLASEFREVEGAMVSDADAQADANIPAFHASTYRQFKDPEPGVTGQIRARKRAMRAAKEVLKGWVPNSGDEEWGLDVLVDTNVKKRKR
ncbi:adenosine deaminase/editase, partial [Aspergillus karnatakaensis]|uniref:tRNA-specific adenosine deaminase n=1 Tax=Aspergillus karnatakaensis TaxID=1810916 RepID=UPI003CCC8F32